jgi:hypothetical protein
MQALVRLSLLAAVSAVLLHAFAGPAASAAKCQRFGGWGTGALQGFASFMAEAAMKNAAKAKMGDAVKIGAPTTRCQSKGLLYECTAYAKACR